MPPANIDITPLAALSRLHVTHREHTQLARQLTSTVALFSHVRPRKNDTNSYSNNTITQRDLRPDDIVPSLPTGTVLSAAPAKSGDFFAVPSVRGAGA